MKLRQIEAFRAVMQCETVTRAAEMLHITQPATTRLIADLEHSVGFPLFLRARGRLYPTPEAVALNEEVTRSLIGLDRIARVAADIRAQNRGSLQIAAAPALSISVLPHAVAEFVATRPDASIAILMHSSRTVVDMVMGRRCDLGLPILSVDSRETHANLLVSTRMACAVPIGHRLAGRPVIRPADLAGEDFISHPSALSTRLKIDSLFAAHGIERRMRLESQVSLTICHMVEAGLGVAIVDPITASEFRDRGVYFAPFEPTILTDFSVLTPPDRAPSMLLEAFIPHLRSFIRQHIDARFVVE